MAETFKYKLKEGNATIEFLSLHQRNANGYLKHLVKEPKKWQQVKPEKQENVSNEE